MKGTDRLVECPCYRVCAALGIETDRWCRYHESELPPPGTWRFDPKEKWCPAGVQANVMMLSALLTKGETTPENLEAALAKVREAVRELRLPSADYRP